MTMLLAALVLLAPTALPFASATALDAPDAQLMSIAAGALDDATRSAATPDVPLAQPTSSHSNAFVTITSPEAGEGSRPGEDVPVEFNVQVIDPLNILYKAQVKSDASGASWQTLPPHGCQNDPGKLSGRCFTTWTPTQDGNYTIRVVAVPAVDQDPICALNLNCAMVSPYYVDGLAPTAAAVVLGATAFGDENSPNLITEPAVLVSAPGSYDERRLDNITIYARGDNGGEDECSYDPAKTSRCTIVFRNSVTLVPSVDGDGNAVTYVLGTVTFQAVAVDAAGNKGAGPESTYDVDSAPGPFATISFVRTPPALVQTDTVVNLTYKVVYVTPFANAGDPVAFAPFTLTDGAGNSLCPGAETNAAGVVQCSVSFSTAGTQTLVAALGAFSTDDDRPVDSLPFDSLIRWTSLELTRTDATQDLPRATLFANPGETYSPAYMLKYAEGDPVGAEGIVSLGGESFNTPDKNGLVRIPVVRADPEIVTFASAASVDGLDGASGPDVTVTWARVVFDQLVATGDDTPGWHDVTDDVAFAFRASFDVGTGTNVPVDGAVIALTFNAATFPTETTAADGTATITQSFSSVTDVTPQLSVVSTPQGVVAYDENNFGRQRWTEVVLGVAAHDEFVNVSSGVTLSLTAMWAHDEDGDDTTSDPVATAQVSVLDALGAEVGPCDVVAGVGTCDIAFASAYDDGLTLSIASSDTSVTRLLDNAAVTTSPVWTRVVVSGCEVDDDFVNRGDTVTLTCTAVYEHDGSNVPSGTFVFGTPVTGCSLDAGTIVDGVVTAAVTCTENSVGAAGTSLPLVLSTAADDVTALAEAVSLDAVWTELIVDYTTSIDPSVRKILDMDEAVTFTTTVKYAHDDSLAQHAVVQVANGERTFRCLTRADGTCSVAVSKNLGESTFSVSAYSTGENLFSANITKMGNTPPTATYRWTAIGFSAFECAVVSGSVPGARGSCTDSDFNTGDIVRVYTSAVAADTQEALAGASFTIDGQTPDVDADGRSYVDVPGWTDGGVTIVARGVSATIEGETVTWDLPAEVTITFSSSS